MKKYLLNWMTILLMVAIVSVGFVSCGDDDDEDKGGSESELTGYWVSERHLDNPAMNGSSGTVTSYGYQFLPDNKVYVFQLHHTGLSSRYSYAEANTSWERLTERNGVSFYINPDKKLKTYTRVGNEVYIDITSDPTIMSITSSGRMEAISLDGWAEGTYVYIGTEPLGGTGGGSGGSSTDIDTEVYVISDDEILMGVDYWQNDIYLYKLQMGFGANSNDAYNKGLTQMRATVWADNGCVGTYSASNIGSKKTYTLYLSSTKKDFYDWITIAAKSTQIVLNYNIEYYNSNDGKWHDVQSRRLTFNASNTGGGTGGSDNPGGETYTGTVQGHDYIDLGLSVKWATCNVGASKPEDKGWFFSWGETTSSSIPDYWTRDLVWEAYEFYDKNTQTCKNIGDNISGTKYDAATKKWGNKWRMATAEEWNELIDKCSWKYTTQNGAKGFLGTGKNGQTIFLPDAGRMAGINSTDGGHYWTANIDPYDIEDAQYVLFHSTSYKPQLKEWSRWDAMSIRAVTE